MCPTIQFQLFCGYYYYSNYHANMVPISIVIVLIHQEGYMIVLYCYHIIEDADEDDKDHHSFHHHSIKSLFTALSAFLLVINHNFPYVHLPAIPPFQTHHTQLRSPPPD